MKKLILISYYFPPLAGVGVFRWAQICKYLAIRGYEIHVITVNWKNDGPNSLTNCLEDKRIHIHRLTSGYPNNLARRQIGNRLLRGIRNKFFSSILHPFFFPHDEAQRWGKHVIPYVARLLEEKRISTVIATGNPFFSNVIAAQLKQLKKDVILIQDFRDSWASNPSIPQYNTDDALRTEALWLENFSIKSADAVVSVTHGVQKEICKDFSEIPSYMIHNGFDPEGIKSIIHDNGKTPNKPFVFIYTGEIEQNRIEGCRAFLRAVRKLTKANIKVDFIGGFPASLAKEFNDLFTSNIITHCGKLSHHETLSKLSTADAALSLLAREYPIAIPTKVYEYIGLHKPIFSISYGGGDLKKLLDNFCWGVEACPDDDNIDKKIVSFMHNVENFKFNEDDVKKFSYASIAKQFDDLIVLLQNKKHIINTA
jgi:hypothetical protein